MKPRLLRLGREFFWVALGQSLVALGGLLGVRLLTGVLPPDVYGELALAMTVVTFVQVALQQPLFEGTRRFFHTARHGGEMRAFLTALRQLAMRVTAVLTAAALIVCGALAATGQGQWIPLAIAAFAVSLISTWSISMSGILNASRQRAATAGQEALQQWLRFGLAVALIALAGPRSSAAMAGYAGAAAIVLAYQVWSFRRTHAMPEDSERHGVAGPRAWGSRIVDYAWPFAVWGAAVSAHLASARWSLQVFDTPESVGLYAALHHVGYVPVLLVGGVVSKFMSPVIFNRAGSGDDAGRTREARQLGRLMVLWALSLTALGTLVAWFAHEIVFAALVAPEYRSVSWLLPIQVFGSGLFVASQSASVLSMVSANSKALLKPRVASAAIGIALNVIAARFYGLGGVVCAGVAYGAISYVWVARVGGVHGELQSPSDAPTSSIL